MRKQISGEIKEFRLSVSKIFLFVLMVCVPAHFFVSFLIEKLVFHWIDWVGIFYGALFDAVLGLFFAWFSYFVFPIGISPKGLNAYSFWGFKRFIDWKDVKSFQAFRRLNLSWLKIYSKSDSKVTYLSLFLKNPQETYEEIIRCAPKKNPLLKFIHKQV